MNKQQLRELLPCPFCGSEAREVHHSNAFDGRKLLSINCINRECHAKVLDFDEIATKKWNSRAQCVVELPKTEHAGGYEYYNVKRVIAAITAAGGRCV